MRNQKRQEKKNGKKALIVGATALMVALVGAMGATTYAKYSSQYTFDSNTATVAKWGFVLNTNAEELFPTDYVLEDGETLATKADSGTGVAVKASNATLAPGTTGFVTFKINGTAEVLAQLDFTFNVSKEIGYDKDTGTAGLEYSPIVWTLESDAAADPLFTGSTTELNAYDFTAKEIDAGTAVSETYTLTWEWALETGATPEEKTANNALDTLMGQVAAGTSSDANAKTEIEFTITANLVQLQKKA